MSATVQSSSFARQGFRRGGRMNPGAPVEKPKDGKKAFGRMLEWFRPEWGYVLCLAFAVVLAVGASVIGPSLQSSAIDKMVTREFGMIPRLLGMMLLVIFAWLRIGKTQKETETK